MRSAAGRIYVAAAAVLIFCVAWAAVAARPWARATADPRLAQLALREQQLRRESVLVRAVVRARWGAYRVRLAERRRVIAAARQQQRQLATAVPTAPTSAVRVVTLPPLTITRAS